MPGKGLDPGCHGRDASMRITIPWKANDPDRIRLKSSRLLQKKPVGNCAQQIGK
ncbi:MAG TPA: hypothetical protein QF683_04545 [SAR324 cluster bacterium]|nr:hypothetical protein [SAR324 cluster bacterium]MDP7332888.1 hypothetical protein [SAR324 cluster bacterium]MDP7498035.1 hypothetical protein [SAR324 cluster bacterium]HJO43895.1 hypothetical protein [SAR324 cluster bacterium]